MGSLGDCPVTFNYSCLCKIILSLLLTNIRIRFNTYGTLGVWLRENYFPAQSPPTLIPCPTSRISWSESRGLFQEPCTVIHLPLLKFWYLPKCHCPGLRKGRLRRSFNVLIGQITIGSLLSFVKAWRRQLVRTEREKGTGLSLALQ